MLKKSPKEDAPMKLTWYGTATIGLDGGKERNL